jgi:hypothetical protein
MVPRKRNQVAVSAGGPIAARHTIVSLVRNHLKTATLRAAISTSA